MTSAPVVVTGTGTDVGKTVATAALAAAARAAGLDVGICKPIQTGLSAGEPGDADEAARLSGARRVLEVRRLPDPLAPETAARVAGLPQATLDELVRPIRAWLSEPVSRGAQLAAASDSEADSGPARTDGRLNLVEGAGGVLVRLGTALTVLDLASELDAPVIVVARAGLGTLSDTELAVRAIESANLTCAGIVIGSWPHDPSLAERLNLEDLPRLTGASVLGRVPEGAGQLAPDEFTRAAADWFDADTVSELAAPRPSRRYPPRDPRLPRTLSANAADEL